MAVDQGSDDNREFGVSEDGVPEGSDTPGSHHGTPPSDAPSAFEIQAPARQVKENAGQLYEARSGLYIKLGVRFRDEWLRRLKGPQLAVFLCLSLHIDEDNLSYPSIDKMCAETGYSNRSVIDTVRKLESKKLVEVIREEGQVNRYILGPLVAFGSGSVHVGGVNLVHSIDGGTYEPDDKEPVNLTTTQVHTKKNHKKNHVKERPHTKKFDEPFRQGQFLDD